ncbi:MAG: hypothetical protein EOO28_33145 [Comamonadaceae bacterium]|nr:MAG: hypothetical protein EOO28_33145 [Comamonadaceae bacterium]
MSKYTGRWVSTCGFTLPAVGVINTYQFGAPSASVVTGTLTSQRYSTLECTASSASSSPTTSAVTLTFLATVPVTSGTPTSSSGTADRVKADLAGSTSTTQTFAFFPDFRTFVTGGATAFFNSAALPYKKQ